jgi:hypothetical protein
MKKKPAKALELGLRQHHNVRAKRSKALDCGEQNGPNGFEPDQCDLSHTGFWPTMNGHRAAMEPLGRMDAVALCP